jgi:HEAT repeat protein
MEISISWTSCHSCFMRKRLWLAALLVCVALALLALIWQSQYAEPGYQGQPLSYWVHTWRTSTPGDDSEAQAARAIRALGQKARPFLLRWLRYEQRAKPNLAQSLLPRIPVLASNRRLRNWVFLDKSYERAQESIRVFAILDHSVAKAAVPTLTTYLNDSTHPITAARAAQALGEIGEEGMPPLLRALAAPHHFLAPEIVFVFLATPPHGTNAARAATLLLKFTRSQKSAIAEAAIGALGAMAADPDTTLPALTNALASEHFYIRVAAVRAIGQFATNAGSAVPSLLAALHDPSPTVALLASHALAAIRPGPVLTNAPAP